MKLDLIRASPEHRGVLKNLMQFYIYDFSEYLGYDVEPDGLFKPYPSLDEYWNTDSKFPYLIKKNEKYVGFALIKFIETSQRSYYSMAEFFILKKCRHQGIGKSVACELFELHKGSWEVHQREKNIPAQVFWTKIIDEYTHGQFKDRLENGRRIQDFDHRPKT